MTPIEKLRVERILRHLRGSLIFEEPGNIRIEIQAALKEVEALLRGE